MRYSSLLALAGTAAAQFRGFNYGNLDLDGTPRTLQDFTDQFNAASALPNTDGVFTSARLFTMIQGGSQTDLISAIQAALDTDTSLLLGLWASGGAEAFQAELAALRFAMEEYGQEFADLVVGISCGSEDLYRISPTGIENESGVGVGPEVLVDYIGQIRETIEGTVLADATIGHVDTWTAWVNASNAAVIEAVDWVGTDAYPYFQGEEDNSISNGAALFFEAYDATVAVSQGKPVWVTETGWPTAGPELNQAQTGNSEAQQYWQEVSCRLQADGVNFWWFTLDDDQATSDDVSFSLVDPADLFGEPLFDLSCDADAAPTVTGTASASATVTGTASASGVVTASAAATTVESFSITFTGTLPDVTFSTVEAPVATDFASSVPTAGGNATGNATVPVAPTQTGPVEFEGSAAKAAAGFGAVVLGLAALAL